MFARLGAAVMSSDDVVHACYRDPQVVTAVRQRFGPDVLDSEGEVDRPALGALVFGDAEARRFLEQLVHPRIHAFREAWIAAERARTPPPPLLVCEIPLLFEVGIADRFDAVLVVTAPESVRRTRVAARGQDFAARSGQQMPDEEKVRRADRYFVNDGSRADLEEWVADRFEEYAAS